MARASSSPLSPWARKRAEARLKEAKLKKDAECCRGSCAVEQGPILVEWINKLIEKPTNGVRRQ